MKNTEFLGSGSIFKLVTLVGLLIVNVKKFNVFMSILSDKIMDFKRSNFGVILELF